jgi:hypothetical protein
MLLGIPGLVVTHVAQDEDGATVVHAETHPGLREQARECHGCGSRGVIRERPETGPRDIPWGSRMIRIRWRKMGLARCGPGRGCLR